MKGYFEDLGNYLSLKDRTYQNIKFQIIRGNLKPGTRLLEEELAKAMSISRAPIREAFNKLEKEGFVTIIPRKGAAVSNVTTEIIEDIFEIRETLETLAVKKSLGKIFINELEKVGDDFKEFINKSENTENRIQYLVLDKKFHDLLSQNCGNKKLIELLTNLQEQIHWLRNISLKRTTFFDSVKEHLAIIEALKRNDEKLVTKTLLQHIERAKESSLTEVNSWSATSK
ncbi:GntR family transcriptional regulator [Candidatus Atribacteria bacterium 1244-E10-H5-B2]|nr:MAG: GntR family transcriptional regulator [Candidatus Atribacteria bacterium 1244-E10-H5-B2]